MKYQGSCHCGNIVFEVEGTIEGALSCNCSICQRKGSLLWFVPQVQFKLLTPPERVKTYQFNKHLIKHCFCPTCGIHPYAEGVDAQGNSMRAINLRCLEDIDLSELKVIRYDGRSV